MSERETYLGDGLYASFDGWQIALRAPGNGVVYLEPSVLEAFEEYVKRLRKSAAAMVSGNQEPETTGDEEPPEPDGECFRGGEAAAYEAEQMARIQCELKR